ncbi:MAG: prolyl oligopeptidase family serine peptidase [Phycisphaerales bacterium]
MADLCSNGAFRLALSLGMLAFGVGQSLGQSETEVIEMREAITTDGRVGSWGRSATHTDKIEHLLVTDTWKTPSPGDPVEGGVSWTTMPARDNGWLEDATLRGGYALWKVVSEQDRVMVLEASGHSMVYVNGIPRAGDPYRNGWPRIPIRLKAGENELLFSTSRGGVRARLVPPTAECELNLRDITAPDLVVGEVVNSVLGIIVINTTPEPLEGVRLTVTLNPRVPVTMRLPTLPPLSTRKFATELRGPAPMETGVAPVEITLTQLVEGDIMRPFAYETIDLRVVEPGEPHKRTFQSSIDGSAQYYAVRRGNLTPEFEESPALFLSLHGASVEAIGQASSYGPKDWGHVVAPTNRRPFGFDWEDWGRLDALEVLDLATTRFDPDPNRVYLTGHSMGGHGTWQIGATIPDRFAAIAPSAGWISFWSYTGASEFDDEDPVSAILKRATNPSDTLGLSRNYLHHGVYVLHGDRDDNVPVEQARAMRAHLGGYHADFAYYERPGAGHWWGSACVDWPPMFDFLRAHTRPNSRDRVEFVTANPGISSQSAWVSIEDQIRPLEFSRVELAYAPPRHATDAKEEVPATIRGATENVRRVRFDLSMLDNAPTLAVQLDDDDQRLIDMRPGTDSVWLSRTASGGWTPALEPAPVTTKGPARFGPFKEAFQNRMIFVYGSQGDPDENEWAYAKARYDAETFWYRGNGSVDLMSDEEFLASTDTAGRNVVLYGHALMNDAWPAVLENAPFDVARGEVRVGDRVATGDDLGLLACAPRRDDDRALVAVIAGSGLPGMRVTDRLPYFVSGVHYPDVFVTSADLPREGVPAVEVAGFLGSDWTVERGDFAWRDRFLEESR